MGSSATSGDLISALLGKSRRAVLALLFSRPDESFYLREVVRASGAGAGAVQRELQRLERAGIVRRWARGRHVFFQADSSCPVFAELRGLILKTAGLADVLRDALAPLSDRIRFAFVYGSLARGEQRPGSDVDVCIIGDVSFAEAVTALTSAQARLGREVNPTVYPPPEFRRKLLDGHHFLSAVIGGEKMMLLGSADELARLAQERLAGHASNQPPGNRRPARRRRA